MDFLRHNPVFGFIRWELKDNRLGAHTLIYPSGARDAAIKHAAEVASGKNVQADKKRAKAESERAIHNTLGAFLTDRYQP